MRLALIGTAAASALNFRSDLIKSLVAKKHNVFVFCIDFDSSTIEAVRRLGAVPVKYSLRRAGLNPFRDAVDMWKLSRQLRDLQPDLVFSYFVKPVIFGTLAAKIAGVKRTAAMLEGLGYVFTEGLVRRSWKKNALQLVQIFLYKFSFHFLDILIFLNHSDPIDLLEKNNIKVNNFYVLGGIGVDLQHFCYKKPEVSHSVTFVFIGRLLAEKGIFDFIDAARIVRKTSPSARFIILGGVDENNPGGLSSDSLETLISEGLVDYFGHVKDVRDYLARASVFVLPSYYREGVPRSTQEAMAIGRAIITTDMPGCRDTVIDGVNGYLIPPHRPDDLARKMQMFINEPELILSMGLQSLKIAHEKYDATEVNKILMKMLDV